MDKKYIILMLACAWVLTLGGCESCKGFGQSSPAASLVQKHIDYQKIATKQSFAAEGKSSEELAVAIAEVDTIGKEIKATYIVKIKNLCTPPEISGTDKLLSCVNEAFVEADKNKVEDADEYMYEKCKDFEATKSTECAQVMGEFLEEFEKAKK